MIKDGVLGLLDIDVAVGFVRQEKRKQLMINLKKKLVEVLADVGLSTYENIAEHLIANNIVCIVLCEKCKYLRRCRACCRCTHPNGLAEPRPDLGTFCSYGIEK